MDQHLQHALEHVGTLTLDDVQQLQAEVDAVIWSAPSDPEGKRHHIFLHLVVLAGKLARVAERAEHGAEAEVRNEEIVGDLLIYAAQLAQVDKASLAQLYRARVKENLARLPRTEAPSSPPDE